MVCSEDREHGESDGVEESVNDTHREQAVCPSIDVAEDEAGRRDARHCPPDPDGEETRTSNSGYA